MDEKVRQQVEAALGQPINEKQAADLEANPILLKQLLEAGGVGSAIVVQDGGRVQGGGGMEGLLQALIPSGLKEEIEAAYQKWDAAMIEDRELRKRQVEAIERLCAVLENQSKNV